MTFPLIGAKTTLSMGGIKSKLDHACKVKPSEWRSHEAMTCGEVGRAFFLYRL